MLPVQQRTTHVLSFKSLVERETGDHVPANTVKALEADEVGRWVPYESACRIGEPFLARLFGR